MRSLSPAAACDVVAVSREVIAERRAQHDKFGEQNHPDGTGTSFDTAFASIARAECDSAFRLGCGTWRHILEEEYREALAETDPLKLRTELIQVAAVAQAWVEAIDRRGNTTDFPTTKGETA